MENNFMHFTPPKEELLNWKCLLSRYSLESINQHLENFRTHCLYYPTNAKRVEMAVDALFEVQIQNQSFFPHFKSCFSPEIRHADFPYYFFRIRKLTKGSLIEINKEGIDFSNMEFEEIQSLKDIWERPAEEVTYFQRLNQPYTSVLYTSLEPSAAVFETNLKDMDLFFLIVYKSKGAFNYSDCSNFLYYYGLSEEENLKRYILFYILRNEFTRILPEPYESENQYYTSYYLSRKFFISEQSQAIQFPSTRSLGQRNFAFWGNIREYLEFVGFRFCYLNKKGRIQSPITILADGFWNDESGRFEYFSPHSKVSKQIFEDPMLSILLQK